MKLLDWAQEKKWRLGLLGGAGALTLALLTVFIVRSGVQTTDLREGVGSSATWGEEVTFDYELYREGSDTPFYSSFQNKQTRSLVLGGEQHIAGLEKALVGMREGGRRRAMIPASMGYQDPEFKGNLVAVVELKKIQMK